MTTREALLTVLDHVDYTENACMPNEMVAACLPVEIIKIAKQAIQESQTKVT